MSTKLIMAIVTITLALIFYTIGVFSERKSGILKKLHLIIFWMGLVFDTVGTTILRLPLQKAAAFSSSWNYGGIGNYSHAVSCNMGDRCL